MICPVCGYDPGRSLPYGAFSNALGGFGMGNMQSLLGTQMAGMEKNYVYLSDEEYDLIMDRREKERRIREAQLREEEVWHPELEDEIATPKT